MIGALNAQCVPEAPQASPGSQPAPERQVAALIYTTGTTGHPKA